MIHSWQELSLQFETELTKQNFNGQPEELYAPIAYTMDLGGKRIRPVLCLLAAQLFSGKATTALNVAIAVEIFHNFTLVHDDIMDEAPLRRGKATVHTKWNRDIAILSGDVMLVKAYEWLAKGNPEKLHKMLDVFNQTAIEVCEGQQYDMNFEHKAGVQVSDYLEMIRLKTAVLLACSLKLGALNSGASAEEAELIYKFGEKIGIAFQIQDDYLDCYAKQEDFGKRVGGDILTNKKTFLLLNAIKHANEEQEIGIYSILGGNLGDEEKVAKMLSIYNELGVPEVAKKAMQIYFEEGMQALGKISASPALKQPLIDVAEMLMMRQK